MSSHHPNAHCAHIRGCSLTAQRILRTRNPDTALPTFQSSSLIVTHQSIRLAQHRNRSNNRSSSDSANKSSCRTRRRNDEDSPRMRRHLIYRHTIHVSRILHARERCVIPWCHDINHMTDVSGAGVNECALPLRIWHAAMRLLSLLMRSPHHPSSLLRLIGISVV